MTQLSKSEREEWRNRHPSRASISTQTVAIRMIDGSSGTYYDVPKEVVRTIINKWECALTGDNGLGQSISFIMSDGTMVNLALKYIVSIRHKETS